MRLKNVTENNRSAVTEMRPWCDRGATVMRLWCNRGATDATERMRPRYDPKGAAKIQKKKKKKLIEDVISKQVNIIELAN